MTQEVSSRPPPLTLYAQQRPARELNLEQLSAPLPFVQHDATSFSLVLTPDTLLTPASEFDLASYAEAYAQHWRHINPPVFDSARVVNGNYVALYWTNRLERSFDATEVWREDNPNARIAEIAVPGNTYTDGSLAGGTYTYKLRHITPPVPRAWLATPNSPASMERTVTIGSLPAAPSNLTATAISVSQINLAWTDNATNEDGFRIERAPGGTPDFAEIASVGANVTGYQNTGLAAATSYSYRVRAYNAAGSSAYSNTETATTLLPPGPLSNTISGPDLISVSGTYEWSAQAAGGTPPYSYGNWYYRRTPPEQLVGSGQSYSRYVLVEPDAYIFRLRQVASDAALASHTAKYFVEVVPDGGFLAASASGVRFADGSCRPRPRQPVARQRWLEALFERDLSPQPCQR